MNSRERNRRRLLPAAALAAPILTVLVLRALGTGHPASSMGATPPSTNPSAAEPAPPQADGDPPRAPLATRAELDRAMAWLRDRTGVLPARSPMDFEPAPAPAAPTAPAPTPEAPRASRPTRPAGVMNLTSVMANEEGGLAAINGRVYRLLDEVEPGWRIVEIDAKSLAVRLEGPERRRVELTRKGIAEIP
ncbi:MAG: hypothetical protein JNK35_05950 [Phycisphaerae bacterium]|nr:hypothetical protein [Phycisphaerae bacterium]